MTPAVTVAIPVLNGGRLLEDVLDAVCAQRVDRPLDVLVADSGSSDGSPTVARRRGATVVPVPRFSHGGTRNLLMERAAGAHVAFLSQDAVPADDRWLARLLDCFDLADDVALVYGRYVPRPGASHMVARELRDWFASLSPDGGVRLDRGPAPAELTSTTFFTDANGCVARSAWQRVPFRDVPYAEDHMLAVDMLGAGYAKAFQPAAAVLHSHDYPPLDQFRRAFDEGRGLREVYGWLEPLAPRTVVMRLRGDLAADWRYLREQGLPPRRRPRAMASSLRYWSLRSAGAALGSRAGRLPAPVRRHCSLERRASFVPVTTR
ncbi:MAG TPA: glycosyltransferase [Solirubrobacteraceae bacterium]